jgi:hypothetical protein
MSQRMYDKQPAKEWAGGCTESSANGKSPSHHSRSTAGHINVPWKYYVEGISTMPAGSSRPILYPPPRHPGIQPPREPASYKACPARPFPESTSTASKNSEWFAAHTVFDDADPSVSPLSPMDSLVFESRFEGNLQSSGAGMLHTMHSSYRSFGHEEKNASPAFKKT